MRMFLITTLVLIPAFVMGIPYEIPAPKAKVDFQAVCDFHNKEMDKLEENIKKLAKDVDLKSDLYRKLNGSKSVCGVLAYRVLPDCATKEGINVINKLDDECAEEKTDIMKSTFQRMINLDKASSGKDIFRSCKDIAAKGLLKQFKEMQGLISGLCSESQSGSSRRRRSSYGGGYYDPSTVWFQYLLCQEQKITCYFFTQGWNQVDYGQYYLYQNALDTDVTTPDDATPGVTTDDDFLALALLSGIGTQKYYPNKGYPYPAYPSPAYPSFRRRRESIEDPLRRESIEDKLRRESTEDALRRESIRRESIEDALRRESIEDTLRRESIEDALAIIENEEAIDTDIVTCTGNACD